MTDTTSIQHPTPLTSGDFTTAEEPFALFAEWFAEAVKAEPNDPNAMSLATGTADCAPSVRIVLMKRRDERGFSFFTNGERRIFRPSSDSTSTMPMDVLVKKMPWARRRLRRGRREFA